MIHSIKMFNLLAQSKLRIKIKTALVYDYIPIIISKCMFSFFTISARSLFILLIFLRNQLMDLILFLIH